MTCQKVVKSR